MRFCVFGDTHCGIFSNGPDIDGINGRLIDIKKQIDFIIDYCVDNAISLLMFTGDFYRDREPDNLSRYFWAKIFERIENANIDFWAILGNHDVFKIKGKTHALAEFIPIVKSKKIFICDEPSILRSNGLNFYLFPYKMAPQEKSLREFLKTSTSKDVALLHGSIEGGSLNNLIDYELFDEDIIPYNAVSHLRAVFAGHLHNAQHFNNVWYSGSVERLDFGDELSNKSFLDVNMTADEIHVKTVDLNARKMITLHGSQMKEVSEDLISVKDAIVRVMGADRSDIPSIRRILADKSCYYVSGIHSLHSTIEEIVKPEKGVNLSEFVKKYAEKVGYKGNIETATNAILDLVKNQS
jgi:exonuclease SbcD